MRTALAAFLLSFCASALAQPPLPEDQLAARLDAAIAPLFPRDEPGGAVILTRAGRTIFRKGFGVADRDGELPIQPEMPFRIGSVTKQLTATAIFLLVDEGKVALDADITTYLPDYPAGGRHVTIEHLLTHSSGIPSATDTLVEPAALALDKTVRELIDEFRDLPPYFAPGEAVRYSNSNYILLGAVIEKVSGLSYADFMAKRVFGPLGMESTAVEGHERNGTRRVEGYQRGRSKPYEKAMPISMTQAYAAGSLVSTVDDLARWGAAIDSRRFLTPESWKRMFRPFVLNGGEVTRSCSGWFAERLAFGREAYGHAGGINGFASYVYWVPQDRVFVAVLLNNVGQRVSPLRVAQTMLYVALPRPGLE